MKNITYGVDSESFFARVDDRIAFFELDYNNMKPENNFEANYKITDWNIFDYHSSEFNNIRWTKKIPVAIKNMFRKHFDMPELKMKPSYYLVIDIATGKYLSVFSTVAKRKFTSSLNEAYKPVIYPYNIQIPPENCMIVEMK
jgi:hypothetical protein